MKALFVLDLLLGTARATPAQTIRYCEDRQPDTTAEARQLLQLLKLKRDTLWYRNVPLEVCSSAGAFSLHFGVSAYYQQAGADVYREDFIGSSPFNRRVNSKKVGVWFAYTLFGRVKTATEYIDGHVRSITTFWPTGRPRRVSAFKAAGAHLGERVIGGDSYYKRKPPFN
jgi:hypothetical protein